jgi:hypothetical protein
MNRRPLLALHVVDDQGRGVWAFFRQQYIASNMHPAKFIFDGQRCNY